MAGKPSYEELEQMIKELEKVASERRSAEQAFQDSNARFGTMANASPAATAIIRDEKFLYVNSAWVSITGYDKTEALAMDPRILFHPDMREEVFRRGAARLKGHEVPSRYEAKIITKDKQLKWIDYAATVIHYDDRPAILAVAVDITARKLAQEALLESEEKYRSLFHRSNDGIFVHDLDGNIIDANQRVVELFGYTKSEILSIKVPMLHPAHALEKSKWAFEKIIRDGFVRFEIEFSKKNGEAFPTEVSSSLFDIGGKKFIQGIVRDISERKLAQEALQESEERYRSLFKNNHSVMLLIDPESADIVDANPAAISYYGWSLDEITRKRITRINTLTKEQVYQEMEQARKERRRQFYVQHRMANGTIRDVEVYSGPIKLHGKQLLYSIVHDVTERKKTEEERDHLIKDLQEALKEIKALRGILPFCSFCNKIKNDTGHWEKVDVYIHKYSQADISHSVCPECAKKQYPNIEIYED